MLEDYPDLLTVDQLQSALQIGRNKSYEILRSGQLKYLRIGKSIRIPKRYLIDFINDSCYTDRVVANLPSCGG